MINYEFYIYILANYTRTVLYVGVTNDLSRRLREHMEGKVHGFTKSYNCKFLMYYEQFQYIDQAISREKEINKWRHEKKNALSEYVTEIQNINDNIYQ